MAMIMSLQNLFIYGIRYGYVRTPSLQLPWLLEGLARPALLLLCAVDSARSVLRDRVWLINLLASQPYLIPFIVEEYSLSEAQRAQLLAAFTPYVLCSTVVGTLASVHPMQQASQSRLGVPD